MNFIDEFQDEFGKWPRRKLLTIKIWSISWNLKLIGHQWAKANESDEAVEGRFTQWKDIGIHINPEKNMHVIVIMWYWLRNGSYGSSSVRRQFCAHFDFDCFAVVFHFILIMIHRVSSIQLLIRFRLTMTNCVNIKFVLLAWKWDRLQRVNGISASENDDVGHRVWLYTVEWGKLKGALLLSLSIATTITIIGIHYLDENLNDTNRPMAKRNNRWDCICRRNTCEA